MKVQIRRWIATAALVLALPVGVAAQTETTAPQTDTTAAQTGTSSAPSAQATQNDTSYDDERANQWLVSGFAGSNFANNASPSSMEFGGSVAYLWEGRYGAEFDAGFTPDFQLQNNVLSGVKPAVHSYMAHGIAAMPLGPNGRWQPFVSGGVGVISLRGGNEITQLGNVVGNESRFGGDVGGGLMGFAGHWGVKADVRYLRASGTYNPGGSATPTTTDNGVPVPTPTGPIYSAPGTNRSTASASATAPVSGTTTTNAAAAVLTGLHFWRANVGVAFRF